MAGSAQRPSDTVRAVYGRARELAAVEEVMAAARSGGSRTLVVHGPPGCGKTTLINAALGSANGTVGHARTTGIEGGATAPFVGLWDLLGPFAPALRELDLPFRRALETALQLTEPEPAVSEQLVALGSVAVLAHEACHRPLVVCVDDFPWLDLPSRAVLLHAAAAAPPRVSFLFTARDGAHELGFPSLPIGALQADAAQALLSERAGVTAPAAVAERLGREVGGNPLALCELARLLTPDQLRGREPIGRPLPVGGSLERHYRSALETLPERCRLALTVVAAEASSAAAPIERAVRALGASLDDLLPAEHAGLVRTSFNRIEFLHPLQRSAAYHTAPRSLRREVHRALAFAFAADDSTLEARAWHRAAAADGPDEEVAVLVEAAARRTAARAGHAAAGTLYRMAAELSPDPDQQATRLALAARTAFAAGDTSAAEEWLADARQRHEDPRVLADIEAAEADVAMWRSRPREAHRLLTHAADAVAQVDPARSASLLATAVMPAMMCGDIPLARALTSDAVERGGPALATRDRPTLISQVFVALMDGDVATVRTHIGRYPAPSSDAELLQFGQHYAMIGNGWTNLQEFRRAESAELRVVDAGRRWGATGLLPYALATLAEQAWWLGRWSETEALASESIALARAIGQEAAAVRGLIEAARLDAACGREDLCQERCDLITAGIGVDGQLLAGSYRGWLLGLAALTNGRYADAARALEETARITAQIRLELPTVVPWEADLVEAYVRAGALGQARRQLASLRRRAEHCDLAWALAVASRAEGLCATCNDEAIAWLWGAIEILEPVGMPFEQARTQLCLGEALTRSGRRSDAEEPLATAVQTFESLGATPWAACAGALLEPSNRPEPTTSALGSLTRQERAVADAIAAGMSNTEAAAALYVTRKTVETHLTHIYRKLGIRSRTELVRRVHGFGTGARA